MARAKTHKDVEFAVDDASGKEHIFKTFNEAAGFALSVAASGKPDVHLDVIVWSKSGAKYYGGSEAAKLYGEDPELSVFERLEINVNYVGMVR